MSGSDKAPQVDDLEYTIEPGYALLRWTSVRDERAPPRKKGRATQRAAPAKRKRSTSTRKPAAVKGSTTAKPKRSTAARNPATAKGSATAKQSQAAEFESKAHWAKAQAAYEAALTIDAELVAALVGLGRVKLRRNGAAAAITDLSRALELEPNNVEALLGRAAARREIGQLKASLDDADQAIKLRPRSAQAHVERGWTCLSFSTGHRQDAGRAFDRATELARDNAEAYAGRGITRLLRGHRREAAIALERALKLDPKLAEALAGRAALDAVGGERAALVTMNAAAARTRQKRALQHVVSYADVVQEAEAGHPPRRARSRRAVRDPWMSKS